VRSPSRRDKFNEMILTGPKIQERGCMEP
jgi:hypothetical protein